jgi:hypothetical protein
MIEERAIHVTEERIKSVTHTMALEDQSTLREEQAALVEDHAKALINGSRLDLWR